MLLKPGVSQLDSTIVPNLVAGFQQTALEIARRNSFLEVSELRGRDSVR